MPAINSWDVILKKRVLIEVVMRWISKAPARRSGLWIWMLESCRYLGAAQPDSAVLTLSNCRGGARKAVKGSGTHSRRAEKYWHSHAELNKLTDKALGVLLKNLAKCSSLDKNVERLVMQNFIPCWILKWLMPSCLSKLIGHCFFL